MPSFDPVTARLLVTLSEEGSIGRVGERENIAPSAVSRRLSDLEARLGVVLFDRSGQGVRATAAGEVYLARARQVLRDIADLDTEMAAYAKGRRGALRLVATAAALTGRLPELLAQFCARYPDIDPSIDERGAAASLAALEDGVADIAIVSDNYDFSRFETHIFEDDRVFVAASPDHALGPLLAARQPVSFASLVDHEAIGFHRAGALDRLLNAAAAELGRTQPRRFTVETVPAMVRLVEAGFGIGFLRATSLHLLAGTDLACAPLADGWAMRKLLAVRRRSGPLSASAKAFMAMVSASYTPADMPAEPMAQA
jgi:DNA-binding transcriptional LysR family regulator